MLKMLRLTKIWIMKEEGKPASVFCRHFKAHLVVCTGSTPVSSPQEQELRRCIQPPKMIPIGLKKLEHFFCAEEWRWVQPDLSSKCRARLHRRGHYINRSFWWSLRARWGSQLELHCCTDASFLLNHLLYTPSLFEGLFKQQKFPISPSATAALHPLCSLFF